MKSRLSGTKAKSLGNYNDAISLKYVNNEKNTSVLYNPVHYIEVTQSATGFLQIGNDTMFIFKDMLRCMCVYNNDRHSPCVLDTWHLVLCGIYKTEINSALVVRIYKVLCQKEKKCPEPQDIDNNLT